MRTEPVVPSVDLTTVADPTAPIARSLARWHRFVSGDLGVLDELLADDVVLYSPVLFRPQPGKELVAMYLTAASMSFVGAPTTAGDGPRARGGDDHGWDGRFRYVRVLSGERDAVLEFETTMNGKYVNGVDMIACDGDGRIVDFKVMVRPLQAVEAVRQMMGAAIEVLQAT